ncbi:regulatory protein, luxR family [Saccharopolyspora kobensis]|uniref:Regulatory protein, luxR family n=1 Tax=Saccharopolyspora kobensis TaxID=146035 RepID=A0A1H6AFW7_9PSEU|nr:LuxR C-terminal-related transcriptional regulator [Saccharopolyspora kobensis]SEG47663.1 regulatory protein, luxR family [Saccharopolyspora kobensis]SFE56704.1 regulatory protein, luxR family [Saccharopolyspora kobensis]
MGRTDDRALDRAIAALLHEAVEHSRAMRHVLDHVSQLVAMRVRLEQSGNGDRDARVAVNGEILPQLTKREKEVLDQLMHGRSNRQIARSLGISERTVKNHLRNLFTKLDVGDRTSAVVKALGARGQ